MLRFTHVLALVCLCCLFLLVSNADASTYTFGVSGPESLTGSGAGKTWTSSDAFVIAGDVYVSDNDTLTIQAGVTVKFDGSLSVPTAIPEIEVKGTIICNGTSVSNVTFTNYSGTTKGLFKGLYLNGDSTGTTSDYEGRLEATYTNFLYGGYGKGIIRAGERSILDLENCTIRHSDEAGIYVENTGSTVALDSCQIDSCAEDGVSWSESVGDNCYMTISECSFVDNDSVAVNLPRRDPARDHPHIRQSFFFNNHVAMRAQGDLDADLEIRNNYVLGGFVGLVVHQEGNEDEEEAGIISNNVFCRCEYGIVFTDIDYSEVVQLDQRLNVIINHNVFWDITDTGLHIGGLADEEDMDLYLTLENNVFGTSGEDDIVVTGPANDWNVPPLNMFETADNCTGADNTYANGPLIDGVNNASLRFRDEEDEGGALEANDYDFHIEWDGADVMLMNRDNTSADADGTDADFGCYGGTWGRMGAGVNGFADRTPGGLQSYYIDLPPDTDPQTGTMPAGTYYMTSDFLVPNTAATPDMEIEAGAHIIVRGAYEFKVEGELDTDAEGVANSIHFEHIGEGLYWKGIYILGDAADGSELEDLEIEDVKSGNAGIEVANVDNAGLEVIIDNVNVHDCDIGVKIYDSNVEITDLTVTNSKYYGLYFYSNTATDAEVIGLYAGHNFGNEAYSSGVRIYNSMPFIGLADDNDTESRIEDNYKFGMSCDGGSPQMAPVGGINWGNIDIGGNDDSQIYLRNFSVPVMYLGENNIMPPLDGNDVPTEYAIEFGPNQADDWLCEENYWGVEWADDVANDLFNDLNKIVFNSDQTEYIDNFDSFNRGMSLISEDRYADAIPYLEAASADAEIGAYRFNALRLLRMCYCQSESDVDDLRDFYSDYIDDCEDPSLTFEAETQAIMTLHDEDRYEDCIDAFEARRNDVRTLSDSVANEKSLLAASYAVERHNEINSDTGRNIEDQIAYLDSLVDTEGDRSTANNIPSSFRMVSVHPNPFNSQTVISFDIDQTEIVKVGIYDIAGRMVELAGEGKFEAGNHSVTWDASASPAGVYFVRLSTAEGFISSRVVLVK